MKHHNAKQFDQAEAELIAQKGLTLNKADNTERGRNARLRGVERLEGQTAEWKHGWDERDYELVARAEHAVYL